MNHLWSSCFFQLQLNNRKQLPKNYIFFHVVAFYYCVLYALYIKFRHVFGYFFAALFKVHTSALCIVMDPFFIVPLIIINPNSFSSSAPPHSIHKIRNKRKNKDFLFFLHMKQYGLLLLLLFLLCLHNIEALLSRTLNKNSITLLNQCVLYDFCY